VFTAGFEKTAKKAKDEPDYERGIHTAAGGFLGGALANVPASALYLSTKPGDRGPSTFDRNKQFIEKNLAAKGLKVRIGAAEHLSDSFARRPQTKRMLKFLRIGGIRAKKHGYINLTPNASLGVAAHEMGHAITNSKIPNALKLPHTMALKGGGLGGMLAGGYLASSQDENKRKWAPAAIAAGHLPTLLDEASATYHGTKAIAKSHGIKKALRSLKHTLPAFGTYASIPLGGAIGAHLVGKLYDKEKAKKP
jgi:hypothetical protein